MVGGRWASRQTIGRGFIHTPGQPRAGVAIVHQDLPFRPQSQRGGMGFAKPVAGKKIAANRSTSP